MKKCNSCNGILEDGDVFCRFCGKKADNADGYLRHDAVKVWGDCITTVKLPSVYMTEEEALEAVDLQTVIYDYVVAESAKFITGLRPLDEIDDFQEELKKLGVEKYVQMYRDAYKTYMDSVFGK